MSGDLPRSQGDARFSATPTHLQPLAIRTETPAVVAEAAGKSDGTLGQSSKSTPLHPVVTRSVSATPTDTSPVLAQRPNAVARSVDSIAPVAGQRAATPSLTPSVVQSTPTASLTAAAVVQRSATPFPTSTLSPTATTTSVSAAMAVSRPKPTQSPRRLPSPKPQPTPTAESQPVEAPVAVAPELIGPPSDSKVSGVAVFEWRPAVPLENGQAYEVVVWSPEQDPNQAWGIAPPTLGWTLEINLDELLESGRFREGSLYWTVLVVQPEPYIRLTLPAGSERRYLVYTASD